MIHPKNYSNVFGNVFMEEEKKWMLMTYYCPTHGNLGLVKPIEITKEELSKKFIKKFRTSKN